MEKEKEIKSQSPAPVSRKVETQSFASALEAITYGRGGTKMRRKEWSDENEYGLLQNNFLMIHRDGRDHNWIVSEGDLMAKDWVIIK